MKTIEDLLKNLARPEVLEFGLVTNRLPSVNIGGKFEPVDDEAPSNERLMQMLVTMGGSRHVDSLSDKPVQWTTRLDGVGVIAVAAIMRKDVVQARFTVAKRESRLLAQTQPSPVQPSLPQPPPRAPDKPAATAPPLPPAARVSEKSIAAQPVRPSRPVERVSAALPVAPVAAVVSSAAAPASAANPPPPPTAPSSGSVAAVREPARASQTMATASQVASASATAPTQPLQPLPQSDEWEDDDEPTLQTLSPPVTGGAAVRAKPARRPAEVSRPASDAANGGAGDTVAAGAAKPPPTAAPETVAPSAAARVAEERAVQERVATAARERLAEQRAAAERQARDRALQDAHAPAPAAVAAKVAVERRISTPTSVDVVDVEIAAKDKPSKKPAALKLDLDAAGSADARARVPRVDAAAAFDSFLAMAVAARASDLLVVAGRPVLLRVATDLLPRTQSVSAEHVERIAREIVPARLREALDNEGGCEFAAEHPTHGRFRVNVSRQRGGFKLNLRVVPREVPTLAALGLPDALAGALRAQRGLILVTSPASQGRSTTLAALVDHLNQETQRHIVTIEEPIEHVHGRKKALVSQREVGVHARSKARALESALREDADVLVVADVGNLESARLALAAAEGGRLVLAAMTGPRALRALDRFLGLFPRGERRWARPALASSLRLVVGQRLVPSTDRTRLHAAVEVVPWSVALDSYLRDRSEAPIPHGQVPVLLRMEDSLAELVRTQKITAEMAKQFSDPSADAEGRSPSPPPAAGSQPRRA